MYLERGKGHEQRNQGTLVAQGDQIAQAFRQQHEPVQPFPFHAIRLALKLNPRDAFADQPEVRQFSAGSAFAADFLPDVAALVKDQGLRLSFGAEVSVRAPGIAGGGGIEGDSAGDRGSRRLEEPATRAPPFLPEMCSGHERLLRG